MSLTDQIIDVMPDLTPADARWLILDEKKLLERETGSKAGLDAVRVSLGLPVS